MPAIQRAVTATLSATLTGAGRIRRPRVKGQLRLDGLSGTVEVFRDNWGVPHIYAASVSDLLYAQGFVHAQDRLWQMDFQRRVVAGRLAEVLGTAALEVDRGARVLGMYRVAEAEVALLSPEARAELEAYAAGVNASIASQRLPVEFGLLRYRPHPWKPADSLCWAKMMAWGLSVNWETELLRARLIEVLGPEKAAELEPLLPGPVIMGDERPPAATRPFVADIASDHDYDGEQSGEGFPLNPKLREPDLPSTGGTPGSNNWVIAGSRTTTGKPILANDMHLPIAAPSIWYENHLACTGPADQVDVAGVTFPGIPYIVAGHNQRVAWGFTNGFPDVQDLFVEHLRRSDRDVEYEYKGDWLPAEVRREEIRVKGAAAVTEEVIVTVHGPVINRMAPGLASTDGPDGLPQQPLALCWTSLEPQPMIDALRAMNRAGSCAEFREALRGWIAPVQNTVFADTEGNIGYMYPGHVPIRRQGDGLVPVPGWTGEYDWIGWIPFEKLPQQENPPAGFIVSANNRVVDETYPYFLGREFALGDRAARIAELIESKPKVSVSDVRLIHLDQRASSIRRLAGYLATLDVDEAELAGLVTLVREWDGQISADSPGAAVCEIFGRLVQTVVMEVRLGADGDIDSAGEIPLLDRVRGKGPTPGLQDTSFFYHRLWDWLYWCLEQPDSDWWDLGQGETRDDVLRIALQRTYNYLVPRLGEPELPGYANWAWGRLHMVTFSHTVGQVAAVAGHFNRGPYPVGGDENTIFATGGRVTVEGSTAVVGPPFRFIADLSDLSRCYGLLAPGNSGRPDSPHYDDQIEAWFVGKYHPMLYKREDVERGARRKLTLAPASTAR
jgi:penicillin G amidase